MSYTSSKVDWAAGDLVTAVEMNRIGNNVAALKDPPMGSYVLNEGANYTTTGTSFSDVDSTNLSFTFTTAGGDVEVFFSATVNVGAVGIYFDLLLDGNRVGGDDGICMVLGAATTTMTLAYLLESLSAGSHTIKLQWKVSAGTGTMYAGAGTANLDVHPKMIVRER